MDPNVRASATRRKVNQTIARAIVVGLLGSSLVGCGEDVQNDARAARKWRIQKELRERLTAKIRNGWDGMAGHKRADNRRRHP